MVGVSSAGTPTVWFGRVWCSVSVSLTQQNANATVCDATNGVAPVLFVGGDADGTVGVSSARTPTVRWGVSSAGTPTVRWGAA